MRDRERERDSEKEHVRDRKQGQIAQEAYCIARKRGTARERDRQKY